MAASKTQLTGGSFQDSLGNPLVNGTLKLHLSQDCSVAGVGFICSGIDITIQLDSAGNVASSTSTPPAANQFVWSNLVMSPQNNFYRVTGFTALGQTAFGPNNQQVGSGATFNLDSWVPNTVISWFPTVGQPLLLEVNGTPTADQQIANFESLDSSVTITDEGNGKINFASSSGNTPVDSPGLTGFAGPGLGIALSIINTAENETTISNAADTIQVIGFTLGSSITISQVVTSLINAGQASGALVGVYGLYNEAEQRLASAAFDTSGAASNAAQVVQLPSPITLAPGFYYFAQAQHKPTGSGLNVTTSFVIGNTFGTPGIALLNAVATTFGIATNTLGGSTTMPSTLGGVTAYVSAADVIGEIALPLWLS